MFAERESRERMSFSKAFFLGLWVQIADFPSCRCPSSRVRLLLEQKTPKVEQMALGASCCPFPSLWSLLIRAGRDTRLVP